MAHAYAGKKSQRNNPNRHQSQASLGRTKSSGTDTREGNKVDSPHAKNKFYPGGLMNRPNHGPTTKKKGNGQKTDEKKNSQTQGNGQKLVVNRFNALVPIGHTIGNK